MADRSPMNRAISVWPSLALLALTGACQRAAEQPPAPRLVETLIQHNDGTAERLRLGALVRIQGMLWLDFEHGAYVANYLPEPPAPGTRSSGFGPDFICADLDIDMDTWGRLMPLSGRAVTATGMVTRKAGDSACPIRLDHVRVVPR